RTWAGRGARMASKLPICKRSKARNSLNTCAWNQCKAVRPATDDEFKSNNSNTSDRPPLLAQSGRTGRHAGVQGLVASRISAGCERAGGRSEPAPVIENHVRVVRARGLGSGGCGLPATGGEAGTVRSAAG